MQHKSVPTCRLEADELAADVLFCLCWSDDFGRFNGGNWIFVRTWLQDILLMEEILHQLIW